MMSLVAFCTPLLLSAFLLILAFPPYSIQVLAWFGLVPLLLGLSRKGALSGFMMAYVCGILYFAFVFEWMFAVAKYEFVHHVALFLFLSIYWGMFGLVYGFISRRMGVVKALAMSPFLWAGLEILRANMGFLSHAGAFLAHSQYTCIPLIQVASLGGVYAVSFIIVGVNAGLAAIVMAALSRWRNSVAYFDYRISGAGLRTLTAAFFVMTLLAYGYGYWIMNRTEVNESLHVSVVQPNIEQSKKWDQQYAEEIMNTFERLTTKAAEAEPSLIIWPEASTPKSITRDLGLLRRIKKLVELTGTDLLMGSSSHHKYGVTDIEDLKYSNSAFLIPPGPVKGHLQRYDKIHLLPFAEYLPLKGKVPWSLIRIPSTDNYVPGKQYTVFEHPEFKFSAVICWEGIFPQLVRHFANQGAQVLVNITNEGWFGKGTGPDHFLTMTVFRAVENRRYVVRCANTGISCIIDHHGRVLERVKNENNEDVFVQGVLNGSVVPRDEKTFYTRYGDVFAWCSLLLSGLMMLWARFKPSP